MLLDYCFKCRAGNVLRKVSFSRESLTLDGLRAWVSKVHSIPNESLSLDFRAEDTNSWVPLGDATDLAVALSPVVAGRAESIFLRATPIKLGWKGSPAAPPPPPMVSQKSSAGDQQAIFEASALLVSASAPLSEFQVANECFTCGTGFGYVFSRRHHCRVCLRSFCDACCAEYYPLVGSANTTPVRHCTVCAVPAAQALEKAEAVAAELETLEVDIAKAVEAEDYATAASLKARREELKEA